MLLSFTKLLEPVKADGPLVIAGTRNVTFLVLSMSLLQPMKLLLIYICCFWPGVKRLVGGIEGQRMARWAVVASDGERGRGANSVCVCVCERVCVKDVRLL